jgi:hypothetical protein
VATRRLKADTLALGLALVGLGLVCTLGNLGHLDALETLHTWWPLCLIVWGCLELLEWWLGHGAARRDA